MRLKCWEDRPRWNGALEAIKYGYKEHPIVTTPAILYAVVVYAVYLITLPFAALNEVVREL